MELSYEIIEDYDSVFPEGYICAQSIAGGTETSIGTVVTLTVSLGRDPDVDYSFDEDVMPDIVGISLDEAKKLCENRELFLLFRNINITQIMMQCTFLHRALKKAKQYRKMRQ